jgi:hypothetical protein
MPDFVFTDVRRFRIKLSEPLFPRAGKSSIVAKIVDDSTSDHSGWLAIKELSKHFIPNFPKRNPLKQCRNETWPAASRCGHKRAPL